MGTFSLPAITLNTLSLTKTCRVWEVEQHVARLIACAKY